MALIDTLLLGFQGLAGLAFIAAGGTKLVGVESQVEDFERFGFPQWFRVATGAIEVGGGLGLLIGIVLAPMYAVLGGFVLIATMAGAVLTHLVRVDDPVSEAVPASVLLVGAVIVVAGSLGLVV